MFYPTLKLSCLTIIVNVQETDKYRIAISITNSSIWCESHGDDCESFENSSHRYLQLVISLRFVCYTTSETPSYGVVTQQKAPSLPYFVAYCRRDGRSDNCVDR